MLNISSINIHIYAIEFVLNKRLENKLPNVRDARYLRRLCWSNILTYSKERENTGSFRSRYKRNPLRFFTRQRLLSRLLPLRNNPLRRHYRAPARPFQPLPLQQSYPSFSYTPPLLVINAHDKVGAHSYSRSLRTLSRTLSLFSSYSSSHFFWSLFFSTDHFFRFSLMLLHWFVRRQNARDSMRHSECNTLARLNDGHHLCSSGIGRSRCQSECNEKNKLPNYYRARSIIDQLAVSSRAWNFKKTSILMRTIYFLSFLPTSSWLVWAIFCQLGYSILRLKFEICDLRLFRLLIISITGYLLKNFF